MSVADSAPQFILLHDLVIRCAQRDEAGLAEYYRLTSPLLNSLVSRHLSHPQEVETVLVNVYVAIWRQAGTYAERKDRSVWDWTLGILAQTLTQTAS